MCWWLGTKRAGASGWSDQEVSDIVFYGAIGAVLGGRLGYVLFYGLEQLLRDPLFALRIWDGGMSFHGGLLGAVAAMWWFGRRTQRSFLQVTDFVAPLAPLGLGFGRLGNFANTELPGRATESSLGLIYPCSAESMSAVLRASSDTSSSRSNLPKTASASRMLPSYVASIFLIMVGV